MRLDSPSPLDRLPSPDDIHASLGRLYREAALMRRLLRLAQAAQARKQPRHRPGHPEEVSRG